MKPPRWNIADLVDFETLIADTSLEDSAVTAELRQEFSRDIKPQLRKARFKNEREKRSSGFNLWTKSAQKQLSPSPGRKLTGASALASLLWYSLLFLLGVSLVIGLVDRSRGLINVTLFLALSIGLQWLILILAALGWAFRNKANLSLSAPQNLLASLIGKFAGEKSSTAWQRILHEGDRHTSIAGWLLAKILNRGALFWNLGIAAGLLGCLSFLDLHFYWESTLENAAENSIKTLVDFISAPWAWLHSELRPNYEQIKDTRLTPKMDRDTLGDPKSWYPFLFITIVFWGILPRLLLSTYSSIKQTKALKNLEFNQPRHRALWRTLHHVERELAVQGPGDEAVVIDCGGTGISLSILKPFLLQRLRIHPSELFQLAVLDSDEEARTYEAIKNASGGVVLSVEAWSLAPSQMKALHKKVRNHRPDLPIWFLVLGTEPSYEANDSEFLLWRNFVDELNDSSCSAVQYHSGNLIKSS